MFEPFPALVAFSPLLVYLIALALIRVSGSVWVISGGVDIALLSFALSGLVIVGPMELFFPKATASILGGWVWLPLILLYTLVTCLWIISNRPRLIVYGRTAEEVYAAFVRAGQSIDPHSTHDDSQGQIHLPSIGAHLRLEGTPGHDCVSVVAFEPMLPISFWIDFRSRLRQELKSVPAPRPRRGWVALMLSMLMLAWLVNHVSRQPAAVVDGMRDWFIR